MKTKDIVEFYQLEKDREFNQIKYSNHEYRCKCLHLKGIKYRDLKCEICNEPCKLMKKLTFEDISISLQILQNVHKKLNMKDWVGYIYPIELCFTLSKNKNISDRKKSIKTIYLARCGKLYE